MRNICRDQLRPETRKWQRQDEYRPNHRALQRVVAFRHTAVDKWVAKLLHLHWERRESEAPDRVDNWQDRVNREKNSTRQQAFHVETIP